MQKLEITEKIVQIAFWMVGGTLAILTYLTARRTILQPIRTEVFKLQLQAMSQILLLFLGKDELALRNAFRFDKLLTLNALAMYDAYAMTFFDLKIEREQRPYNSTNCPSMQGYSTFADEAPKASDRYLQPEKQQTQDTPPDSQARAARWALYRHGRIYINRECDELQKLVRGHLQNPVLPEKCVKLLESYLGAVGRNELLVRATLAEAAKEMPGKYPTLEKLNEYSLDWVNNSYVAKFEHLKPTADTIIQEIRTYFGPDNLIRL